MSKQELEKTTYLAPSSDGFDSPDDDIGSSATFVKFDGGKPDLWFDRTDDPIARKPWIAVQCRKEAVYWQDKKITDRIDESQQPDIEALNKDIPEATWEKGFDGEPKPPWQMQFGVYFINQTDGSKIISSNSTYGQKLAYAELKDRVQSIRKLRGAHVVPVVELASKTMKTRFGVKTRPHFEILEWRNFGGPSSAPAIAGPVAPPTAGEIVNDEIVDHGKPAGIIDPETFPWDDSIPITSDP